jgi:hypothetical protein
MEDPESLCARVLGPDIIRKVILKKLSSKVVVPLPGKVFSMMFKL